MKLFCVPSWLKAIKKTISGLIGMFTIKKNRILFESSYFINFASFFAFLSHLETSHFSYQNSINDKPLFHSNEARRAKNIVFKELLMFFLIRLKVFVILIEILKFFLRFD